MKDKKDGRFLYTKKEDTKKVASQKRDVHCKDCGYFDPAGWQGQSCPNCGCEHPLSSLNDGHGK